jgi:hypothetical protein
MFMNVCCRCTHRRSDSQGLSRKRRIIRRCRAAPALPRHRGQRECPTLRAVDRQLAAIATPASEEATGTQDHIIDAVRAQSIHADAVRTHPLAAWVIVRDQIDYPGDLVVRLVTDVLTPYVLLADTLAGLHAQLPLGLVRLERQAADPPEIVETWISAPA